MLGMEKHVLHKASRKLPLWEGIKASAWPAAKGILTGAVIGAAVGVVTATLFGLISQVTTGDWNDLFQPEDASSAGKDGAFKEMNGFTGYKVQTFFNAIIVAGITSVNNIMLSFTTAYKQAEAQNKLRGEIQEIDRAMTPIRAHYVEHGVEQPTHVKAVLDILEQGKAHAGLSHEDTLRAREQEDTPAHGATIH